MNLKRKLMAIAAFVLASALPAAALEYNDGKITWNYVPVSGTTNEVCLGDGTNACISAAVEGAITLPDVIGGKRVTTVADNAFKGCTKVTGVSILGNLEWIEEGAFDGATSLKTFGTLNRNENFFSYQGSLYMGDWENAELVRVPPALEVEEFSGLVKPQVGYVYPGAFNGCASIRKIQVNYDSAEALSECSFAGCSSFVEFMWAGEYWDDDEYCVKDGVLYCGDYERDGWCELMLWPTAKPIADFESIKFNGYAEFAVREGAFAGNLMEKITIPAWMWIDSSYAFAGCVNLREIAFLGGSCGMLYDLEDAGINLKKVVYPGFPRGMAEDWELEIEWFKGAYPESKIVFERGADPNAGKANLTIPYTERWDLCWKYDFEAYAKDLTTLTFEGPCPDEFMEILEICSNVTKVVYSANPIYRDADHDWTSWKEVKSWDWSCEFPGRTIVFEEGAIPSETQFYFEDPECCDCLYGIWYYDEQRDQDVCLSPIWPARGELRIPDGIYELGKGALCGLDQVTKLVLPQSMAWDGCIDENVGFETMFNLVEIEVEGGSSRSMCDEPSILYSKDGCLYYEWQLFRVPPAYAGDEFVLEYSYDTYFNALTGCKNIKKLTVNYSSELDFILEELDLAGCDQLAEFGCNNKPDCEGSEYRCVDGAIYEDWGDGELCLLLWPNAKRPIEFAKGTVEVDCEAFRYVNHPKAITELTVPSGCWLDFEYLAEDYGFTGITKLVFEGEADIDSGIVEALPGLKEIVYSPSPFYAWNWEWIREDFAGTGVKFVAAEPDEPLYGYELDVWDEDDYGNIPDGECYLGYEGYPFVYPALKGAYEIPEKIENCRVVWAYENAFADMGELEELTFPRTFRGIDAGSYREGYWDEDIWEWVTTGEVDIVYSPFVGCTSLKKLTFNGACPEGLWEVLELTPSIKEVVYNGVPWAGDYGYSWSEFIAEFRAEHPDSQVVFTPMEIPEEPLWNVDSEEGWLWGEYYPEDGVRIPCVWPDLVGEATVPDGVYGIGENAFACMSNLTALTFPQTLYGLDAGVLTVDRKTGVPLDSPRTHSPFVGCTSLTKLTFDGACPEGLWEVLELTPTIREVYYNDSPWCGEGCWIWRDFIAEFQAEYPEANVAFIALPPPEEPVWNIEYGELYGEYDPETGWRVPCVWPDLVGEAAIPSNVYYIGENAFACMSSLTALTIPATVEDVADTAFVGCTSLKKLVFEGGYVPSGVWELLELTPSIEEVVVPGWKYRSSLCEAGEYNEWLEWFIRDYMSEHPESQIKFMRAGAPDEPIWFESEGELYGEYDPETGWRVPCVWPDLVGEATVPSGVYYIGENAFACMSNLTALAIPASVESFGVGSYREGYWNDDIGEWIVTGEVDIVYSPFVGCTSLKKLVFQGGMPPDGVWELLELTPSIEEVVVPSWMYRAGGCDEEWNEWLEWFVYEYKAEHPDSTIVFKKDDGTVIGGWEEYVPWKVEGDTMTVDWWACIDEGAFDGYDLSAVTKLVLPAYLDYVEDGVFGALTNLREVEVVFSSYNEETAYFGSMFGEDQRVTLTLKPEIGWCCDCEYCYADDLEVCPICKTDDEWGDCNETCGCPGHWEISEFAVSSEQFEGAEWIEKLVIEEPCFAVADYAFVGCVNLKEAVIPASVEWMGESVFADCENLEKAYFNGNAPYGCLWLYEGASSNLVSYVKYGTTGWTGVDGDVEMPVDGLWPVWEEGDAAARAVEYGKATVKFLLNDELLTSVEVLVGEPFALIPDQGKVGYTFDGWYDEAGEKAADDAEFTIDDFFKELTFSGTLTANSYTVAFDANGGEGVMGVQKFVYDQPQALSANAFGRKTFEFVGWSKTADGDVEFADGAEVCNLLAEDGASLTLYAVWERSGITPSEKKIVVDEDTGKEKEVVILPEDEPVFEGDVATTYDGFVISPEGDVLGMIQVKAAKANKTGISKLTATMQLVGEKKLSFKGGEWGPGSEYAEMALKDGRVLTVAIGEYGLVGTFGENEISGSANIFSSKKSEDKKLASDIMASCKGTFSIVYWEDNALGTVTLTVAAKGKVTAAIQTPSGASVKVTTQMLVGDGVCCIPVVSTSKKAPMAFTVWIDTETLDCSVEGLGDEYEAGKSGGGLDEGACFRVDADGVSAALGDDTFADFLPLDVSVRLNGKKLVVSPDENGKAMKAGKIVWDKKAGDIDWSKSKIEGYNVSKLKLTYTEKTGAFKGSFTAYALVKGKVKSYTFKVTGVILNGCGYGTATYKKSVIPVEIDL